MAKALTPCVGLFGTCGGSTWRDPVIAKLASAGIECFNPQKADWKPEDAAVEAEHLATDKVLLFTVTDETEAFGSLAEIGFAALSASKTGQQLFVVIQDFPDGPKSPANRTRTLVKKHAEKAGIKLYSSVEAAMDDIVAAMQS